MDEEPQDNVTADGEAKLAFHYMKSNLFRVVHVDGAWGGVTPNMQISMTLFSERPPIPQKTVHKVNLNQVGLGPEIMEERVAKEGIIRELEAAVVMSPRTAKNLIKWLQDKVNTVESIEQFVEEQTHKSISEEGTAQ